MSQPVSNRWLTRVRPRLEQLEERENPSTILAGFDTVDNAQNTALGGGSVPPDSMGAAGPDTVVTIVNTTIASYTKTGTQLSAQSLNTFFASLAVNGQNFNLFDPKIVYDVSRGRYVAMCLDSDQTAFSRILVAVSNSSDPNAGWKFQAINSFFTISGNTYWTDFPGLAVDENAIYITGNVYPTGAGAATNSRLWVMDKQIYSGGTSTVGVYDPFAGTGISPFTIQIADIEGTRPAGATNGTYLVNYDRNTGIGGNANNDEADIIRVDNPLNNPTFTLTRINLGNIDAATNPATQPLTQPTGIYLDGGDQRALDVVWRNNTLVFTNTITPPTGVDAGQPTVNVVVVDTSGSTPTLTHQINVGGEDIATGTGTAYGSVAINAAGVLGLGFSASGPNVYPGAYFTSINLTTGAVQPTTTVKASNVQYNNTYGILTTIGGIPVTRWGDYSATFLDPTDDSTFWVFNEYSKLLPGTDGNWGEYAARIQVQTQYYAVGADAGGGPNVKVFNYDGSQRFSFDAYPNSYTGGVRVALADVNGDQIPDIITATGASGGPNVRVFDGSNLQLLYSFYAYPSAYVGGINVAAGDLYGDGSTEIVTGADAGGGPNVRVFKLGPNGQVTLVNSFYAYSSTFTGGVRVAVGDYNNDGAGDIITSPGFGGNPHIEVFDGRSLASKKQVLLASFMATGMPLGVGAYVATGHLNGDGVLDFVVGSGSGSREVRVYDGRTFAVLSGFSVTQPGVTAPPATTSPPVVGALIGGVNIPDQLPANPPQSPPPASSPTAGLRVAVADINGDGEDDILAIGGPGDGALLRIRNGKSMTALRPDAYVFNTSFTGGAFVAASQ